MQPDHSCFLSENKNFKPFTGTFQAYREWLPDIDFAWNITLIASKYPSNFKHRLLTNITGSGFLYFLCMTMCYMLQLRVSQ